MAKSIFNRYSKNLNDLRKRYNLSIRTNNSEEELLNGYLCPITLDYFPSPDFKELSKEHVPQDKLGGSVICLTNKDWNSGFGTYDNHAIERVKELALNRLNNKISSKGGFQNGMTGRFEITQGDKLKITFISNACNESNPNFLTFLESMKNREEFKFNLKFNGQLTKYTKLAYLKNAYLILFSYFGYGVVFGKKGFYKVFSEIRNQLRNPNKDLLPSYNFVYESNDEIDFEGVYLVERNNDKTLGVFYKLVGKVSLGIYVIFPSLSQKNESFFSWTKLHHDVQLTKINKTSEFLSLESILGGKKAEFLPSDY